MVVGDRARTARFWAGDPLRGIAALGVLAWHVAFLVLQEANLHRGIGNDLDVALVYGHPLGDVLRSTTLGVDIFFVLSGYLIARPFVRAYIERRPRPRLRRYAGNRILRIWPAFLAVCAVLIAVHGLQGATVAQTVGLLLLTDISGPGWSQHIVQSWSLNVELAFYTSVPLFFVVVGLLTRRLHGARARAGLLVAIAVVAGVASIASAWDGYNYATLPHTFWAFVPGLLLAIAEPFAVPALAGRDRPQAAGLWAAVAGLVLILAFMPIVRLAGGGAGKFTGMIAAALVVGGPLVAQWAGARSWRVLDNALTRWLGTRSYPIFLVHWAIAWPVAELVVGWELGPKKALLVSLVLTLAATAPAAELLHRLVERPAMRRRRPASPPGAPAEREPAAVAA